ncbi:MAG TPA: LamG domain-containing protein [Candidatus Nanoarchaeia archaeon]|nr:LamG domain-containing protein [Candidatus Nanoarchaeia archaeon]
MRFPSETNTGQSFTRFHSETNKPHSQSPSSQPAIKLILLLLFILIFTLKPASAAVINRTIFNDGFEGDIATNWSVTGSWNRTTGQKNSGTFSAVMNNSGTIGNLTTISINASNANKLYITFYYRDDDCDAGDILLYYNDSSGNWDEISDLGSTATEDTWIYYNSATNSTITDPQYLHSGFAVRIRNAVQLSGSGGNAEYFWVDDMLAKKEINITAPSWSNPQKNATNIYQNDYIMFNTSWTDTDGLAGYIFSINQTGTWANSTLTAFSGTSNVSQNITQITASAGTTVQWKFYANDTDGLWNMTDTQEFTVRSPVILNNQQVTPRFALNNTAINISANVTSDTGKNLDKVVARIYYPNGTSAANYSMTNSSGSIYWNASYTVNFGIAGTYNITIFANITEGASTTAQTNFTPILNLSQATDINISGEFTDWGSITSINDILGDSGSGGTSTLQYKRPVNVVADSGGCNVGTTVPENAMDYDYGDVSTLYNLDCSTGGYGWVNYAFDLPDGQTSNAKLYLSSECYSYLYNFSKPGFEAVSIVMVTDLDSDFINSDGGVILKEDITDAVCAIYDTYITLPGSTYDYKGINTTNSAEKYNFTRISDSSFGACTVQDPWDPHSGLMPQVNQIENTEYAGVWYFDSSYFVMPEPGLGSGIETCYVAHIKINSSDQQGNLTVRWDGFDNSSQSLGNISIWNETNHMWTVLVQASSLKSTPWNLTQWESGSVQNYLNQSHVHIMFRYGPETPSASGGLYTDYLKVDITNPSSSSSGGGGNNFDIANYSLANNNTYLFARIGVNGSIDFSDASNYYAVYISTNDPTTGSQYTAGGGLLPFLYDYRLQVNNSVCTIYNYTNGTIGACNYSNNSNTIEISANLSLINMTNGSVVNITFETGSTSTSYDFAPDYNSFLEYTVTEGGEAGGGWANSSFDRCKNITITNPTAENLTNFPVYINLTYDSDMLADFKDIRFYSTSCSNGGSALDYEIENYTTSTRAHIWTRIPSLLTTGTTISIYYKNNTAVSSGENPAGVWDNNYAGVWHMQRVNATDSTSNANNGNQSGGVTLNSSGRIDGADEFDSNNDYINMGNSSNLQLTTTGTVETWLKYSAQGDNAGIISKGNWYSDLNGYTLGVVQPGDSRIWGEIANETNNTQITTTRKLNDTAWHHVAFTWNGTYLRMYADGISDATPVAQIFTPVSSAYNLNFGKIASNTSAYYYGGTMDEARISNTARNDGWINMSYLVVANQSSYVSFGEEQSQEESSCTCPDAGTSWVINMSHSCNITSACDITTGYLNFTGTGYVRFNATINVTGMERPITNQTIYIENNCNLIIN